MNQKTLKVEYFDIQKNWRKLRRHVESVEPQDILVRDFNMFTFGRWKKKLKKGCFRPISSRAIGKNITGDRDRNIGNIPNTRPVTGWSTSISAWRDLPYRTNNGAFLHLRSTAPCGTEEDCCSISIFKQWESPPKRASI